MPSRSLARGGTVKPVCGDAWVEMWSADRDRQNEQATRLPRCGEFAHVIMVPLRPKRCLVGDTVLDVVRDISSVEVWTPKTLTD